MKSQVFVNYFCSIPTNQDVPSQPHDQILNDTSGVDDGSESRLQALFQQRPMWLLTALKASLSSADVKKLKRYYYFIVAELDPGTCLVLLTISKMGLGESFGLDLDLIQERVLRTKCKDLVQVYL
jgi:hypothetical protein